MADKRRKTTLTFSDDGNTETHPSKRRMSLPEAGLTITPTLGGDFDGAMLLCSRFIGRGNGCKGDVNARGQIRFILAPSLVDKTDLSQNELS